MNVRPESFRLITRAAMTLLLSVLTTMTAWANDAVTYIDMDGKTKTVTEYTEVTTDMTADGNGRIDWSTGTYVVKSDVTLNGCIRYIGKVIDLIVCDGATLTVNGTEGKGAFEGNTLNIYAQSNGTGMGVVNVKKNTACNHLNIAGGKVTLDDDGVGYGLYVFSGDANGLTVNGGDVTIQNSNGSQGAIYFDGNGFVTLSGGKLTVTNSQGNDFTAIQGKYTNTINFNGGTAVINGKISKIKNINLNGGNVTVNGEIYSFTYGYTVTYDFTRATDSYYINAFSNDIYEDATRTVQVKNGVSFRCNGKSYSGTLTDDQISAISGKTMTPDISNHFSVNDAGTEYTIHTAKGWGLFCDRLAASDGKAFFSGKTVRLANDITVTRMAGADYHDFCGTFDGGGNTLTFNATATDNYLAPFRNVLGNSTSDHAVIHDLNVVTNITAADYRHMAGLIAEVWGYVDVVNCNVTANITATKGTQTELYPAGLASQVVSGAQLTVSGCTVGGTISTDGKYAGGIIGIVQGSASIVNSACGVTINSSTAGDGTHGGLVAVSYPGSSNIEGCVFNGKLLTVGTTDTKNCGGFVGWRNTGSVTISNSLYAPADLDNGETEVKFVEAESYPSATFVRNGVSSITNSYYTRTLGTSQGLAARTIAAGENVSVAHAGEPTVYDVSGITAYKASAQGDTFIPGLLYNNVLYAGNGEAVSLTLTNTPPTGYVLDSYTASPDGATLSEDGDNYTLTMPDADVTVSVDTKSALRSTGEAVEVSYVDANGNGHTAQAIALDGTETDLGKSNQETWYFVGLPTVAFDHRLNLSGDVHLILADGCTMNIGTNDNKINDYGIKGTDYALDIYAQSLGNDKGTLAIYTKGSNNRGIFVGDITINGGTVTVNTTGDASHALYAYSGNVAINGGTVSATLNSTGFALYAKNDVTINGGTVTATGGTYGIYTDSGIITLGWTTTSDFIYASSYSSYSGTIKVVDGQALIDGSGHFYSGTLSTDDITAIADQTLRPHWPGSGTEESPYIISRPQELDLLAHRVNGTHGQTANNYYNKYFQLAKDIAYSHSTDWDNPNSTENNYEAIGYNDGTDDFFFCGHFDGAGHTVSGIRIYRNGSTPADKLQGIFGQIRGATIRGLRLADARITGYEHTGGIVGYTERSSDWSSVTDCHVANNVCIHTVQSGAFYHGGVVGQNDGTVENCTSAATLTIADDVTTCPFYGAIVGENYGGTLRDNLAIGANVPADDGNYNWDYELTYGDNYHGAIIGRNNNNGTLQRNYYTACTVANVKNATGVGCGGIDDDGDYIAADVNGAVPALRDNADNTQAIALLAALASTTDSHIPVNLGWDAGKYPMQLAGRTLYKDGAWNTLCLPFDVTVSGSVLDGTGVEVKTLTSSAFEDGTLTLNFSETSVATLTAGTPYIIRWTKPANYVAYDGTNAAECSDLVNPVFTGVTVSSAPAATETAGSDYVDFVGTYQPASIYESGDEKHNLYLGTENKLYYPTTAGITVNAFRGYFRLKNGLIAGEATSGDPASGVRAFVLNFGDETTGIVSAEANSSLFTLHSSLSEWYTLDGRRLQAKPTRRGLYIHNGIKVVIK